MMRPQPIHGIEQNAAFRDSPLHPIVTSGDVVRRRLDSRLGEGGIPLLRQLQEQGATDYLALPLTFSSGRHQAITFATDHPAGFAKDEIARLVRLAPILALMLNFDGVLPLDEFPNNVGPQRSLPHRGIAV